MENAEFKNPTDKLRLKFLQRIIIVAFGVVALCSLISMIPLVAFVASGSDSAGPVAVAGVSDEGVKPGETGSIDRPRDPMPIGQGPMPIKNSFPVAALIPPMMLLAVLGLVAYGAYDLIRLFLQYRISKERDEVLFP